MTYRNVYAVDPGGTTGFAVWQDGRFRTSGQIAGRHEFDVTAAVWLDEHAPDTILVVCERFSITQQTIKLAREYDALYIIGWLEHECVRRGIDFVLQTPGDAKQFCSNDRLKKAGMWKPTTGGHANDAARHLFLRLCMLRELNPIEVDKCQ